MTKTEEETERLGSRFAKWFLTRDDVPSTRILCLNGDVGSGKSVFSRGFVREIVGQHVDVPSPYLPFGKRVREREPDESASR